ncbi:TolC family protein [Anaerotignum sp.]|uniref:TolC family protein n=1 Tax=Anaerotignum sp. TaxID=2039241 RepID=UPI00289BABAD|nr:TolC family protein [Anaerotignum sp.]
MKKTIGSARGAVALALVVTLFGTTAYAAEATSATETVATQGEQATPVLTVEEALEKAKKHSVDLADLQKQSDFLQETKEDIWDAVGAFSVPTYEYQKWVDDGVYSYTSGIYSTNSGMTVTKYSTQITNLVLETTVKSTFSSIVENEESLELLKEMQAIKKTLYEQGQTKYNLGMLSKYKLDQLKAEYDTSKVNVYQLERNLEQMYINLNNLMGESADKKYVIEYDVEFEPYVLQGSLEAYINASMKNDYSILLKEQAVEDAKFNKNFVSESTLDSTNKKNKLTYESAQRAYKSAKEDKEIAIRNAYIKLQQSEVNYNQLKADLEQTKATLKTAEVNYKIGNTTKLTLDQAQLAVTKDEFALKSFARSYDMQVFTFKNTSLIAGGSTGTSGSSKSGGSASNDSAEG